MHLGEDKHSDRSRGQIVALPKCPRVQHVCTTGRCGQGPDSRTVAACGTVLLRSLCGSLVPPRLQGASLSEEVPRCVRGHSGLSGHLRARGAQPGTQWARLRLLPGVPKSPASHSHKCCLLGGHQGVWVREVLCPLGWHHGPCPFPVLLFCK